MRAPLIALLGIVAMAGIQSASAADLEPQYFKAPPPIPVFSWTGFYLGANLGGSSSTVSFQGTQATPFGSTAFGGVAGSNGDSGFMAGGAIGFNYEFPMHVVVGVEGDGDWVNLVSSIGSCSTFASGVAAGCATNSTTLNNFETVRGRLGYALPWGPIMVYGTGGWARASVSGNSTLNCLGPGCGAVTLPFTGGTASFSNTPSGWTAGGGVEWAFVPNWTLRMEYLHLEFDNVGTSYASTVFAPGPIPSTTHITSNNGVQVWRIGLSYLFHVGGY
jgi:outer membrane immunogenic protein